MWPFGTGTPNPARMSLAWVFVDVHGVAPSYRVIRRRRWRVFARGDGLRHVDPRCAAIFSLAASIILPSRLAAPLPWPRPCAAPSMMRWAFGHLGLGGLKTSFGHVDLAGVDRPLALAAERGQRGARRPCSPRGPRNRRTDPSMGAQPVGPAGDDHAGDRGVATGRRIIGVQPADVRWSARASRRRKSATPKCSASSRRPNCCDGLDIRHDASAVSISASSPTRVCTPVPCSIWSPPSPRTM